MELWLLILLIISIFSLNKALLNFIFLSKIPAYKLPPGPRILPVIGNIIWLRKSYLDIELTILSLHQSKLGPMITLQIGPQPQTIFISDASLAHRALFEYGKVFCTRPEVHALEGGVYHSVLVNINSIELILAIKLLYTPPFTDILGATSAGISRREYFIQVG
ncbi:Cytochrome P450 2W1 [Euphorbia peplus]|nr:Cytochrome P450 2W1 [Euphorbia peplus]